MFKFFRKMFGSCDSLEARRRKAVEQDKQVRESMSQKDWDKQVQSTMAGSDPIAKY